MPDNIGSLFFVLQSGTRTFGWTESHYLVGAAPLPEALVNMRALARARAKLLGAGVTLKYIRVSDRLIFNDSQVDGGISPTSDVAVNAQGVVTITPVTGAAEGAPYVDNTRNFPLYNPELLAGIQDNTTRRGIFCDQPPIGYLLRLEGGTTFTARRSHLLRGLPDAIVTTQSDRPSAAAGAGGAMAAKWLSALDDYETVLLNEKYGMRAIVPSTPTPITSIVVAGGIVTVTCPIVPPLTVGQRVRISGVRAVHADGEIKKYSESLTVRSIPVPGSYIFTTKKVGSVFVASPVFGVLTVLDPGVLTLQTLTVLPYKKVVGREWGKHDTGRPFDAPVGRRKRVRR